MALGCEHPSVRLRQRRGRGSVLGRRAHGQSVGAGTSCRRLTSRWVRRVTPPAGQRTIASSTTVARPSPNRAVGACWCDNRRGHDKASVRPRSRRETAPIGEAHRGGAEAGSIQLPARQVVLEDLQSCALPATPEGRHQNVGVAVSKSSGVACIRLEATPEVAHLDENQAASGVKPVLRSRRPTPSSRSANRAVWRDFGARTESP
jgi:hypothetical protein